jgi:DNA repair protein RadC
MANARPIVSARQVYARLTKVRRARQEQLLVFCLDTRGCVITRQVISVGNLNSTMVHSREVFYPAIVHNAASIIVAHNHPSGDSTPSDEDVDVTARLE